ncbi:AtpZ/AtpI family protein [Kozakia baliensis]|uniref:AtpZ/AtpI family protein n=1 Tax=Kozakia baliensis TaxID=153496 RepID=UPI001F37D8B9|nr:AtpZ/AtpI family protein [Kozakia baliensis]
MSAQDDLNAASQPGDEPVSFNARLAQAEARARGKRGKEDQSVTQDVSKADYSALGLALRAGTELVAALAVGVAIGYGLDRWLGFRALFLILFSLLGGVAGMLNVWRAVGKIGA